MASGVPDQSFIHGLILMAVHVACGSDGHPVDLAEPVFDFRREPPRRLRNDFESADNCIDSFPVRGKGRQIEPLRKRPYGVNIVDNVAPALGGFLEGIDGVVQDAVAEQWLESSSVHHIARAIEDFIDVELQSGVLEDPHGSFGIEID
jgi:hypothetical protein